MELQKAVQFAYDFFSTKTDIWPDQCERVNESLRKPGAIRDEVTLDVSETDIATASLLVELALLKESLSELIRLIDGFRIVCRKETTQAMRQKQQICHKLMVLIQSLKQLDLASDGLISKYHEELQANIGSNISGKESQLSLQTQKFQQNSFVVQPTSLITDRTIPSKLREAMLIAYNLADLELLCANLNIRYADLGDGPLDLKIQRLIEYCQHRGMYEALIQEVLKERPHLEALL